MDVPVSRLHRLATPGGSGLSCDEKGLALGPMPLAILEAGSAATPRYRARPAAELSQILRLAYGAQPDPIVERFRSGLQRVVELLEAGEVGRAGVHAVLLGFPEISPDGMAKLAGAVDLEKGGSSWMGQPRVSAGEAGGGQWTSDGGGSAGAREQLSVDAHIEPAIFHGVPPAQRAKFVRDHLAAALKGAKTLGVPAENILGLSALESTWGTGKFAINGNNNFFNIHYPARGATGFVSSGGGTKVSKFTSYANSLQSFIELSGSIVQGKSDPDEFARALQDSGKFGIYPDGSKVPTFVHSTALTIIGIRALIAGNRT